MKKADREALQNQVPVDDVVVKRVYSNSLGKGLSKILKVALHRSKSEAEQKRIKANLFRKLIQFRAVLDKEIETLEQFCIDNDVREFFAEDEEYVKVEKSGDNAYATIKKMTTASEWKQAQHQRRERDK